VNRMRANVLGLLAAAIAVGAFAIAPTMDQLKKRQSKKQKCLLHRAAKPTTCVAMRQSISKGSESKSHALKTVTGITDLRLDRPGTAVEIKSTISATSPSA
jgi:hypothetical protein